MEIGKKTPVARAITIALAASVFLVTGLLVGHYVVPRMKRGLDNEGAPDATKQQVPTDATKHQPISFGSFLELRREYDELRKTPSGVQWDFIEKAEAYAKKTKDSTDDNDIRTLDLLTDCYLKLGDLEDARAAFRQYLDRVEQTKGKEEAAKRARDKADQMFYRDNKYFDALSFYELMSHRYPDTDHAAYGQFMAGKYFLRTKEYDQAIEEFAAFSENYPDSKYARKAKQELYTLYFNQGDKYKAIDVMLRYANDYREEDDICYANFKVGMAYYALGAKEYENANRHFKSIADAYPNNRFSKQAVSMVRLIDQKQKKSQLPDSAQGFVAPRQKVTKGHKKEEGK